MHKKNLLNVAKALDESPTPQYFRMSNYIQLYTSRHEICGTPHCALGHYAAREDLQKLLKIVIAVPRIHVREQAMLLYASDGASAWFDDRRILRHFDISMEETDELFGNDGCGGARTPEEAAQYIRDFVRRKELESNED